jgi:hypothetical protein
MTPEQAKHHIERACEAASAIFLADGEFHLLFHFGKAGGDEQVVMPPPGADKDATAMALRGVLAAFDAEWVVVVTEAWTTQLRLDEPIPRSLENHPGREEVLIYQLEDRDAGMVGARQQIIREPGKPVRLGPLTAMEIPRASYGRLVGLLPPKGLRQ